MSHKKGTGTPSSTVGKKRSAPTKRRVDRVDTAKVPVGSEAKRLDTTTGTDAKRVESADELAVTTTEPIADGTEVDNSKRNEVDRDDATLTADDQSNARTDVEITAAIRRSVVARDGMSTYGKNVKIITQSGHVTLREPVKTESERAIITDLARQTPGVTTVTNELSVTSH